MGWIRNIVDGLIETYETKDVYELIDLLDINLIKRKMLGNKKGRFLRNEFGDEFIFVSDGLSEREEEIVLLHELGHLILHTELSISFYSDSLLSHDKLELQANKFVAYILIYDNILNKIEYEDFTLEQIAIAENINIDLLKLKFNIN